MGITSFVASFRRKPYRNIFFWLMFVVLVDALVPNYFARGRFADLMIAAILLIAMVEAVRTRNHRFWALALGLPAIASRVFAAVQPDTMALNTAVLFLSTVFMGFLVWILLHDLQHDDRPTDERIYGALCAYVFIGLLFALVYTHLEYRQPGSFSVSDALAAEEGSIEASFLPLFTYFSFVTMTTLGFGDISPVTEHARTLVWFQALLGQLYLAVMVAGFVALHISKRMKENGDPGPTDDSG